MLRIFSTLRVEFPPAKSEAKNASTTLLASSEPMTSHWVRHSKVTITRTAAMLVGCHAAQGNFAVAHPFSFSGLVLPLRRVLLLA
jgi:hypothetical protein